MLLDNRAKISADNDGVTPLHIAIQEGNQILFVLIYWWSSTIFGLYILLEIYDVAERIIRARITDVNFKTNSGKSPLHMAAEKGNFQQQ